MCKYNVKTEGIYDYKPQTARETNNIKLTKVSSNLDNLTICSARYNACALQTPKSSKSNRSGLSSSRKFSTNVFKNACTSIKSKSKGITVTSIDGKKKNKRVIQLPSVLVRV